MSNKTELKENLNVTEESKPAIKKRKHVSALVAAAMGRSALDHAKAHSHRDVTGTSGLSNTGPFVSYENEG